MPSSAPSQTEILLINLGSPDSPSVVDVRRYLAEFLSDERVIDLPWLARQIILRCFILPFRPQASAAAYQTIWTPEGSPLVVTSRRFRDLLQEKVQERVEVAMRYGRPSIPSVLEEIVARGTNRLLLVPLYPHYAMSSYETVVVCVQEHLARLAPSMQLEIVPPFYEDPSYIASLVEVARPHLDKGFDHLLFSYHGVPERHLHKSDPTHQHCLVQPQCCECPSPAHTTCYRHQTRRTSEAFAKAAGVSADRYTVAYQSRFGRDPWLQPYTDETLVRLAQQGVRRIAVVSPAFVTDCLETLEEIAERGKESFLHAGGAEFEMIPCLNTHPRWVETVAHWLCDLVADNTK